MVENIFTVAIVTAFITLVGSITYFKVIELNKIESNVQSALEKGIDPLAVRCAYATQTDTICIAYAASKTNFQVQTSK
jgi:ATP/ADP translocase